MNTQWNLSDLDRCRIEELIHLLRSLIRYVRGPSDLIAIGEAWGALEQINDGEGDDIDVVVGIDVGYQRGDRDFSEGLYACFKIDDDGVLLNEFRKTYDSSVGSDHFTVDHAVLRSYTGFDDIGYQSWLQLLKGILAQDDVVLETSRDHV